MKPVLAFRANFAFTAVAIIAAFVIAVTRHPYLIITAMATLGVCLLRRYWMDFRRAYCPSSVFSDLAGVVRMMGQDGDTLLSSGTQKLAKMDPKSAEYEKEFRDFLSLAYVTNHLLLIVAQKLKGVLDSRKLDAYLMSTFAVTFAWSVLVFGFEYWGLYKIEPNNFKPAGLYGFWDFLGFSFSTMMTGSVSPISPAGTWAQILGNAELLVTALLLIIVVTFVLGAVRERYREDMDQVITGLEASAAGLLVHMATHYKMTYEDIERSIVRYSVRTVNDLRRWRGLPRVVYSEATVVVDETPSSDGSSTTAAREAESPETDADAGKSE